MFGVKRLRYMPVIFLLAAGFPYWFANLRPSRCRQGRSPQKSGDFPCLSKAACSRREGICKRVCLADERPLIKLCLQTETLRAPAQPGRAPPGMRPQPTKRISPGFPLQNTLHSRQCAIFHHCLLCKGWSGFSRSTLLKWRFLFQRFPRLRMR